MASGLSMGTVPVDNDVGEYRPLVLRSFQAKGARKTAEDRFWTRYKSILSGKEIGAVSHIDFSRSRPFHIAVTASTRVIVYDAVTRKIRRTYARFKDRAYSGTLRADGNLLVAGGEDGVVQVFEFDGRTLLRQLTGHKGAVRVALFAPDKTHILSAGDDTTVRLWNLTSGEQIQRMQGHADYVRAAAVNPVNGSIWATGSYDHTCRLWDVTSGQSVLTVDHGAPVEALTFHPSGTMFFSAGGTTVKVWDALGTGSLIASLSSFQKTVTCLAMAPVAGPDTDAAMRLLAGSLDGHVRIFELDNFKLRHTATFEGPVLSLGISPDARTLAVGMADGSLVIKRLQRKRPPGADPDAEEFQQKRFKPRLNASNRKFFSRGASEKPRQGDHVIPSQRRAALAPYDKFLRQFKHREALNSALQLNDPVVVFSLIDELASRGSLDSALGARDPEGQTAILQFVCKHISNPRYSKLLIGVANRLLNIYAAEIGRSPLVKKRLRVLQQHLHHELGLQEDLQSLSGILQPILAQQRRQGS